MKTRNKMNKTKQISLCAMLSAMGVVMMVVSILCVLLLSGSFKMGGQKRNG